MKRSIWLALLASGLVACENPIEPTGPQGSLAAKPGLARAPVASVTDLETLPGATSSQATGINNRGQVVGVSGTVTGGHAVLWEHGTITDLGTLPGHTFSQASGINNQGVVQIREEGVRRLKCA
jgi:probable HAF family extracellular repeat protein